jgi:hypothetical protein
MSDHDFRESQTDWLGKRVKPRWRHHLDTLFIIALITSPVWMFILGLYCGKHNL